MQYFNERIETMSLEEKRELQGKSNFSRSAVVDSTAFVDTLTKEVASG